ncbi:hypothetical protein LDVICp056 [lymphocystis disease virus-China]|uniref:Uncharacterized protein n=2 Tax=Lymphocystis disease virus 2 TaxID=159183 RepID=A0A6F8X388_9VIRU|nr:hypothetical protein LDVICp056 [lymphocystis disease virus-China]AAU10902.1 hypothetical protein [lymphocystis disease virus-China]BCB67443.1 hypothetical protein [Lymphocystis disease virus 2]
MGFFPDSKCKTCNYFEPCGSCLLKINIEERSYLNQILICKILKFKTSVKNFKNNPFIHLNGIISKNLWQLQLEIKTLKKILKPFYLEENIKLLNNFPLGLYQDRNPLLCLLRCIRSVINLRRLIICLLTHKPEFLKPQFNLLIQAVFEDSFYITTIVPNYKVFFNDIYILDRLQLENLNFSDKVSFFTS